jgi:hypothetical protein
MDIRTLRIFEARAAGLAARLIDEGFARHRAEQLVDDWDKVAVHRGLARDSPAYWSEAAEWILAQPRRP